MAGFATPGCRARAAAIPAAFARCGGQMLGLAHLRRTIMGFCKLGRSSSRRAGRSRVRSRGVLRGLAPDRRAGRRTRAAAVRGAHLRGGTSLVRGDHDRRVRQRDGALNLHGARVRHDHIRTRRPAHGRERGAGGARWRVRRPCGHGDADRPAREPRGLLHSLSKGSAGRSLMSRLISGFMARFWVAGWSGRGRWWVCRRSGWSGQQGASPTNESGLRDVATCSEAGSGRART
jgi:hypothetical protein